MKLEPAAIAIMSVMLGACSAPQAPVSPEPTVPAEQAPSTQSQEAPMAKRAPGQEDADPLQIFRAFGTEPFWNINVEGDTLTYTTPEDQAGQVMQGQRHALADGVEVTGTHEGKAFTLTVAAGHCNDGMSDNQYTLVSSFRFGEIDYKGCGEAAK